jgi:metal transporter CNNM
MQWTGAAGQTHTPDLNNTIESVKNGPPISGIHAATVPSTPQITTATHTVAGDTSTPPTGTLKPVLLPGLPIAIPLFRGFGFLTRRSKSAPPVPRDQPERRQNPTPRDESEGENDEKERDGEKIEMVKATELHDDARVGSEATPTSRVHTGPMPTTQIGVLGNSSQEIRMPKPVRGVPKATIHQLGMTSLVPPAISSTTGPGTLTPHGGSGDARSLSNTGSASPPPSLEAIILERNRRRLAREMNSSSPGNQSTGGGHHGESGGVTARNKGFKSTPLSPPLTGSTGGGGDVAPASD